MNTLPHKTCSKCKQSKPLAEFHVDRSNRDGLTVQCRQCRRLSTKLWQLTHVEYRAEYGKQWREQNKEYDALRKFIWYQDDPEWRRAYSRKYRKANKTKVRIALKRYAQNNPNVLRAIHHKRRARIKGNGGTFTAQQWHDLKAQYNFTCLDCGKSEPDILLTPDHIIPISKGGSNDIGNIQPLCFHCNTVKHVKTTDYRP